MSNEALNEAVKTVMPEMGYEYQPKGDWVTECWKKNIDGLIDYKTRVEALARCEDLNKQAEICLKHSTEDRNLLVDWGLTIAGYRFKTIDQIKECGLLATAAALKGTK